MHVTARLAWHADGWNGRICKNPSRNTFCVGSHSYPGDMIAENRDLNWETEHAGKPCSSLNKMPPCVYSINAFGSDKMRSYAEPPAFFNKETQKKEWDLPPSTVSVWPYEEMYRDDVRTSNGRYDNDLRFEYASEFFTKIEANKSLIFYYANYSNPFSTDETPRYVLIGLSRVSSVGDWLYYDGCNEETKKRYGGGFVWDRNITSNYPSEGLRLPYHFYQGDPRIDTFVVTPEDPNLCKYGSKLLSDDQALGLVEQFLQSVKVLQEMGDTNEDWNVRRTWLESLINELWTRRGAYPGLPSVCEYLGFEVAIPFLKDQCLIDTEHKAAEAVWAVIEGPADRLGTNILPSATVLSIRRRWKLESDSQDLLKKVLTRIDLNIEEIKNLLSTARHEHGIRASASAIRKNPYLLTEQYVGDSVDSRISWSRVDRGVIPSPHLGIDALVDLNSPERLRAISYECLHRISGHTFLDAPSLALIVQARLNVLPDWKRINFHQKYFSVDEAEYSDALHIENNGPDTYVYRLDVYEDERYVEEQIQSLTGRPLLTLKRPMLVEDWRSFLFDRDCVLAKKAREQYEEAISSQVTSCQRIFTRAFSVLCGSAGTGKTTVLRSFIKAIRKVDGEGASVMVLAPTGKAADRARAVFEKDETLRGSVETSTVHSFLAKRGWLNPNLTFVRFGGEKESEKQTIIIDECSMMDLSLFATLFRSIKWSTVKRLVLVGDPNQLPPIGIGRVFADIVDYCRDKSTDSIAELSANLRQLESKVSGNGTGIVSLASLYRTGRLENEKDEATGLDTEELLRKIQAGGDVDRDLRIVYWNEPEELSNIIVSSMTKDMGDDAGIDTASVPFHTLWDKAYQWRPEYSQILSPYRGELYGIEAINLAVQKAKSSSLLQRVGSLDGITLFDKVIQTRNRTASDPIYGYNPKKNGLEKIDVFNGELGFAGPHGFDRALWKAPFFRIKRLAVAFSRKGDIRINYGHELGNLPSNRFAPDQPVENNLELGYAISVHKAQGSEFERIYVVIPGTNRQLLSQELLYTALTRATRHCTLFVQRDVGPLIDLRRRERCWLAKINSSLLGLHAAPKQLIQDFSWYKAGKIHEALSEDMVRSKSEVIIANLLHLREIPFEYEVPLYAEDGSMYLPDFTIKWRGEDIYWEHLGRLDLPKYREKWEKKHAWYETHFKGRLLITTEGPDLSRQADSTIEKLMSM